MLHYFHGEIKKVKSETFLVNPYFGVQVAYAGGQSQGEFFLYPYLDDQKKSVFYFAFDTFDQKEWFERMLKISGIGPKIAFQIVKIPMQELAAAIDRLDTKIFQTISGVGPKLAKKIILELKGNFDFSEVVAVNQDQKLFKAVVKSLQNLGYDVQEVKSILASYPKPIEKEHLAEVVKWVIAKM